MTTSTLPPLPPDATVPLSMGEVIAYVEYCLAGVYVAPNLPTELGVESEPERQQSHSPYYRPMLPYGTTGSLFGEWEEQ